MTRSHWVALLLAAIILTGLAPAVVRGQDPPVPGLAIETATGEPAHVVTVYLEPGQQETVALRFRADSDTAVEAEAWVANVVSPVNGGVSLSPPGAVPEGPAAWVSFPDGPLTLVPGDPIEIDVAIAIPADARAGLWTAAIAIQSVNAAPAGGSAGVDRVVRDAAMLAISVEGELEPGFTLGEAALVQRDRGRVIQVPVANPGNVPVSPRGTLSLFDISADADAVFTVEVAMGTVHAETGTILEIPIDGSIAAGTYTVVLELIDPDSGATAAIDDGQLVLPEIAVGDQAAQAEIRFQEATVEPEGDPVVSMVVDVTINNTGSPVSSARLILIVTRNGSVLEESTLAGQVSLPTGLTTLSADYSPPVGFLPGEWTFALRLDAIDQDGEATTIATTGTLAEVIIP